LRRLHFPRISTHLLRPLHVDKRGRQPCDSHKLHAGSTVEAENNALVVLLMRHASGFRVDGDAIRHLGPSAYHGLHGGCSMGTRATARRTAAALQQLHAHHRSHWFNTATIAMASAALAQPTSTHLVSVHNHHVAIIKAFNLSSMHDSDEEAVALRPHPPELGRPAFVRHAAGGGGGMQRQRLL
jgi:hypothetical protein